MAEKRTRRRFTREFKAQAVQHLLDSGKPLSDVATELGLSPGQLSQWRTEQIAAGSAEALVARTTGTAPDEMISASWASPCGVEGSVRNPSTPGGWNDPETNPTAVYP